MEVILQKDVERLGKAFEIVKVKDGYAMNYLVPRKLAQIATDGNKKRIQLSKKSHERKEAVLIKNAHEMAKKLEEVSVTITVKVGDADQLYGSVSPQLISEKLAAEGFNINKKDIRMDDTIKALGVYTVKVHVHQDITADIKVWVVKEGKVEEETEAETPSDSTVEEKI